MAATDGAHLKSSDLLLTLSTPYGSAEPGRLFQSGGFGSEEAIRSSGQGTQGRNPEIRRPLNRMAGAAVRCLLCEVGVGLRGVVGA